ncbi:mitochondrial fission 1 protein [Galdieria sulphuraria]|uniref:Mitochondrial fission 1 protein n=1 Tax=Galdieria sulphuraria TaxID=130081 RepID=M2Y896_GALSU|nr:mitochondrial fission 1 protein [Galdieria sulphuraria]EME32288.1 mitochondrial fission 1 protein [Galdieria sulphuraria]|eukprot:XP_005708808.1 mitochondrial fission 1 protein [Galdieria sulphuraria]
MELSSVNRIEQLLQEEDQEAVARDIQKFRELYDAELEKAVVDPSLVFQLAWALVRSNRKKEIKEGSVLFQLLVDKQYRIRESLFFLSFAQYKLGDTVTARRNLKQFLERFPESRQGNQLMRLIEGKIQQDAYVGMGVVGAVIVGIVGLCVAAFSKGKS